MANPTPQPRPNSAPERRRLTRAEYLRLVQLGWTRRVGTRRALWVRAERQELLLVMLFDVLAAYPCSTARAGLCNTQDSFGTPTGWHVIAEKIGSGLPPGAVLKGRCWTGEVWRGQRTEDDDLILTRILRLEGLEDGINRGGRVDSWRRCIYIHGTNHEARLGSPSSHGCVRLSNKDVLELYRRVRSGCLVLISA